MPQSWSLLIDGGQDTPGSNLCLSTAFIPHSESFPLSVCPHEYTSRIYSLSTALVSPQEGILTMFPCFLPRCPPIVLKSISDYFTQLPKILQWPSIASNSSAMRPVTSRLPLASPLNSHFLTGHAFPRPLCLGTCCHLAPSFSASLSFSKFRTWTPSLSLMLFLCGSIAPSSRTLKPHTVCGGRFTCLWPH